MPQNCVFLMYAVEQESPITYDSRPRHITQRRLVSQLRDSACLGHAKSGVPHRTPLEGDSLAGTERDT